MNKEIIDKEIIDKEIIDKTDIIKCPPGFETNRELAPVYSYQMPILPPLTSMPLYQFYTKKSDTHSKKDNINIYSAGILPFYVNNKNIYFLLGKDPDGKWSDFGGRSELSDEGRWDITAAREFYEETIGSIMDIQTVLTKLQNKKSHLRIRDKTLNGYPYYMYTIKIAYKDIYRYNFRSTYSFIKYINSIDKKFDYKYLEKTDIQWINIETIKKGLLDDNCEYPLRSIFKRTIEGHLEKIINFCGTFNEYNFNYSFQ